jgi:hypothetical protein
VHLLVAHAESDTTAEKQSDVLVLWQVVTGEGQHIHRIDSAPLDYTKYRERE